MDPVQQYEKANSLEKAFDTERGTPAAQSDAEYLSLQLLSSMISELQGDADASNEAKAAASRAKKLLNRLVREESKYTLMAADLLSTNKKVRDLYGGFNLGNSVRLAAVLKAKSQQNELDDALNNIFEKDNLAGKSVLKKKEDRKTNRDQSSKGQDDEEDAFY